MFVSLFACLLAGLVVCLFVCLIVRLFVCLSVCPSVCVYTGLLVCVCAWVGGLCFRMCSCFCFWLLAVLSHLSLICAFLVCCFESISSLCSFFLGVLIFLCHSWLEFMQVWCRNPVVVTAAVGRPMFLGSFCWESEDNIQP